MNNNTILLTSEISEKRNLINYKMPSPDDVFNPLRQDLIVQWIYCSNALEGNTLNIDETATVLSGVTVGGKTINEHLEVLNHKKAIDYLENIINDGRDLSEDTIKNIHELLFENIDIINAGTYRKNDIKLPKLETKPISYTLLQSEMSSFIKWYKTLDDLDAVSKCAMLLGKFINISPFSKGNMKVALLILNFELIKNGLVPIVIDNNTLNEYIKMIKSVFNKNNYDMLTEFIAKQINDQLDNYIQLLL